MNELAMPTAKRAAGGEHFCQVGFGHGRERAGFALADAGRWRESCVVLVVYNCVTN